jgi:hypothetical protein
VGYLRAATFNGKSGEPTVQPRRQTSFPFVVAEPTRRLDVRIELGSKAISSVSLFQAFIVSQNSENPKITFDPDNKILEIHSIRDEWLLPGNGLLLYWSK